MQTQVTWCETFVCQSNGILTQLPTVNKYHRLAWLQKIGPAIELKGNKIPVHCISHYCKFIDVAANLLIAVYFFI